MKCKTCGGIHREEPCEGIDPKDFMTTPFQQAAQAAAKDIGDLGSVLYAHSQTVNNAAAIILKHFAPLEAQSKGLDKIARMLISEGLVNTDDIADADIATEVHAAILQLKKDRDEALRVLDEVKKHRDRVEVQLAEANNRINKRTERIQELEKVCHEWCMDNAKANQERDEARREVERLNEWKLAVEDACIILHLGEALSKPPKECLHNLICYENQIALDPQVSREAVALRDFYKPQVDQLAADNQRLREALSHWQFYADHNRSQTQFEICVKHLSALSTPPPSTIQDLESQEHKEKDTEQ